LRAGKVIDEHVGVGQDHRQLSLKAIEVSRNAPASLREGVPASDNTASRPPLSGAVQVFL
jgi:hypothetical protein